MGRQRINALANCTTRGGWADRFGGVASARRNSPAAARAGIDHQRRGCGGSSDWTSPKKQRSCYSGKRRRHTLKSQVVSDQATRQIVGTAHGKGRIHDFKLFKASLCPLAPHAAVLSSQRLSRVKQAPSQQPHPWQETPPKQRWRHSNDRRISSWNNNGWWLSMCLPISNASEFYRSVTATAADVLGCASIWLQDFTIMNLPSLPDLLQELYYLSDFWTTSLNNIATYPAL